MHRTIISCYHQGSLSFTILYSTILYYTIIQTMISCLSSGGRVAMIIAAAGEEDEGPRVEALGDEMHKVGNYYYYYYYYCY